MLRSRLIRTLQHVDMLRASLEQRQGGPDVLTREVEECYPFVL